MAEKTKWDIIRERKLRKKQEAAIRAGGGIDQSWKRYTYCRICGQKICVNNYPDHKPRLKRLKVNGVIICPWCKGHGGEFTTQMYNLIQEVIEQLPHLETVIGDSFLAEAEAIMVNSPKWKRERALKLKEIHGSGTS